MSYLENEQTIEKVKRKPLKIETNKKTTIYRK